MLRACQFYSGRAVRCLSSSAPKPLGGFIATVAQAGAQAILGNFISTGNRFDKSIDGLVIKEIGSGLVVCELTVEERHSNSYGTLHGGATSTIVDIVGTMAALTVDPLRPGVSVDMAISFLSAARVGDRVRIEGRCLRSGSKLAFTEVKLFQESGKLVATGTHTKAL